MGKMKRKGREAKLNFLILLETPPPGYCRGTPQIPPSKIPAPGGPLRAEIDANEKGNKLKGLWGISGGPGTGESSLMIQGSSSVVKGRNISYPPTIYLKPSTDVVSTSTRHYV